MGVRPMTRSDVPQVVDTLKDVQIRRTPSPEPYIEHLERLYFEATLEILCKSGFAAACTTLRLKPTGMGSLQLKRIGVGGDSESLLAVRLGGLFDEAVRARLPRPA
jgi:hypothetical protein